MVLKLSKKVHFLQSRADLSQKSKSVKVIYIYVSESSYYSLSENDMVYRGLSHRYEMTLAIKISKKMPTEQKSNKILQFQTLRFQTSSKH